MEDQEEDFSISFVYTYTEALTGVEPDFHRHLGSPERASSVRCWHWQEQLSMAVHSSPMTDQLGDVA